MSHILFFCGVLMTRTGDQLNGRCLLLFILPTTELIIALQEISFKFIFHFVE